MSQLLSLYPEHPIISWRDELFNVLPIDAHWWPRFFLYLEEHATSANEIGFTIARVFDLIGKNQASPLIRIFPTALPFDNVNSVLEGIYTYRLKLGHILNRNLEVLPDFKLFHWNLICSYARVAYDPAYKILLWAWSKHFWVPHAFDEHFKMPFRYMLAAMILKHNTSNLDLFASIKQYWIGNNQLFPKNGELFDQNIHIRRRAWFNLLCPEYTHITDMLFDLAQSLTLAQLYELLINKASATVVTEELPEIIFSNY